jgi:hypothetical protein
MIKGGSGASGGRKAHPAEQIAGNWTVTFPGALHFSVWRGAPPLEKTASRVVSGRGEFNFGRCSARVTGIFLSAGASERRRTRRFLPTRVRKH